MEYFGKLARAVGGTTAATTEGDGSDASSSRTTLATAIGGKRKRPKNQDDMSNFTRNWELIKLGLETPDQRALHYGISRTDLTERIQALTDSIVFEHNRTDEGSTGSCMEFVLRSDVLGQLVQLSEYDKPAGVKKEVIRAFANLVILLDSHFLAKQPVHNAILRLLRSCISDDGADDETMTEEEWMMMDEEHASERFKKSAGVQGQDYEEDLVDLLCHICSRIRSAPELLTIFMHPKLSKAALDVGNSTERPASPTESESSASTLRAGQSSRQTPEGSEKAQNQSAPDTPEERVTYTFPIFTFLLRFIHREGKIGEVARAGALFCINLAMGKNAFSTTDESGGDSGTVMNQAESPDLRIDLARMIADSDFAEVFGASLGAVYGLLPGRLAILQGQSESAVESGQATGMSVGSGPRGEKQRSELIADLTAQGIENNESVTVKAQVKLLVSLLEFAQDTLSAALDEGISNEELGQLGQSIASSLSNAVRNNFLQSILYPSMLECNDVDWSAVAVMSYIEVMLLSIEDSSPLADIIIGYLAAEDMPNDKQAATTKSERRKSAALLMVEGQSSLKSRSNNSYFSDAFGRYTLKDLIMGHITPTTQVEAFSAALRLATTLFERHGRFAIKHLTSPKYDTHATVFPMPGTNRAKSAPEHGQISLEQHFLEMKTLFALSEMIEKNSTSGGGSLFGFDQALFDAEEALGSDSLFAIGMQYFSMEPSEFTDELGAVIDKLRHRISPSDRFYRMLVKSLSSFFTQAPEVNIALTGLIRTISLCPVRSLEGWLTFPSRGVDSGEEAAPVLLSILHALCQQVIAIRNVLAEFDSLLTERRSGLIFVNNLQDAIAIDQEDEVNLLAPRSTSKGSEHAEIDPSRVTNAVKKLHSESSASLGDIKVERSASPERPKAVPSEEDASSQQPAKQREGFARWFGGSRSRAKASPRPSLEAAIDKADKAVPFAQHYSKTDSIQVQVRPVKIPKGPWTDEGASGGRRRRLRFGGSVSDNPDESGESEESFLYPGRDEQDEAEGEEGRMVSLSALLDNVVILQETIKELAAIVQTRRSVGIDALATL